MPADDLNSKIKEQEASITAAEKDSACAVRGAQLRSCFSRPLLPGSGRASEKHAEGVRRGKDCQGDSISSSSKVSIVWDAPSSHAVDPSDCSRGSAESVHGFQENRLQEIKDSGLGLMRLVKDGKTEGGFFHRFSL